MGTIVQLVAVWVPLFDEHQAGAGSEIQLAGLADFEAGHEHFDEGANEFVVARESKASSSMINKGARIQKVVVANPWRRRGTFPPEHDHIPTLTADDLLARVGRRFLVFSLSHDDYTSSIGGVQNVVHAEQRALNDRGIGHLHLSPVSPFLGFAIDSENAVLNVKLDGVCLGSTTVSELERAFRVLGASQTFVSAVVHHLSGHAPELVLRLLRATGVQEPRFWLHDLGFACPNPFLLRNDLEFCGAPPAYSSACMVCRYGAARPQHLNRMKTFLSVARPSLVAPSAFVKEFWESNALLQDLDIKVIAPLELIAMPRTSPSLRIGADFPIRIAHLGNTVFHKGWGVFSALAERFSDDPRYEFMRLGFPSGDRTPPGIRVVDVRTRPEAPSAMADAIANNSVDVAVIWSLCQETFSYVAHEALAGGAFLLVPADSGNLGRLLTEDFPGRGMLLQNESELGAFLAGEGLRAALASSTLGNWRLLGGRRVIDGLIPSGHPSELGGRK